MNRGVFKQIVQKLGGTLFIWTVLSCWPTGAQGLHFRGMDYSIEDRTSMSFRIRNSFTDSLSVRFDFAPTQDQDVGYIFRAGSVKEENNPGGICLFYDSQGDGLLFRVIWEGHRFITQLSIPKSELQPGDWLPVRFCLYPKRDSVALQVGRYVAGAEQPLLDDMRIVLSFGKNKYRIDVPSFDMRRLSITADRMHWNIPLDEDSGNRVHSSGNRVIGKVSNPEWLNRERMQWKKVYSRFSPRFSTCGYDADRHQVYIIGSDSLTLVSMGREAVMQYRTGHNPLHTFLGASFPAEDGYYCYEVFHEGRELAGTPTMARLDKDTHEWTVLSTWQFPTQLHHHDLITDTLRRSHYLFGGFGNRLYSNQFYRQTGDGWEKMGPLRGDAVWPRYFSAAGWDASTDKIYLFGGMGNEIGDHIVGRQYLYDFFEIDPETLTARKLWELNAQEPNKVPVRNLVLPGDGCFYTLFYPESYTDTELQLCRFSLRDGSSTRYANPLPMNSDHITTNANLYYDERLYKLIAVTEESTNDIDSRVTVYTLSFPPMERKLSTLAVTYLRRGLFLLFLILLIVAFAVVYLRGRNLRSRKNAGTGIQRGPLTPMDKAPNAVFLFGDFAVYDPREEDISVIFSEKLRHMLLLLLYGGEKGVSSKRLKASLWPDKDDNRAKNLCNVTMNKLRKALSQLEDVSIVFEEGSFILRTGPSFHCDYMDVQKMLTEPQKEKDLLLRLLARGKFLRGESDPLFDKMKEATNEKLYPLVQQELWRRLSLKEYGNVLLCADILCQNDPLDEDALAGRVQAYRQQGREEDARSAYQAYISQYKREYDEDYSRSYDSVSSTDSFGYA